MVEEAFYGIHAVLALLQHARSRVDKILLGETRMRAELQDIVALAAQRQVPLEKVARTHLDRVLGHKAHQGVVAFAEPLTCTPLAHVERQLKAVQGAQTIVALDGVTDVGNFAALMRAAVAFGVNVILLPRHHSVGLTPTTMKRSAGAAARLSVVQAGNLVRTLEMLKGQGFWIFGAEARAEMPVARVVWPERIVLILGAEGRGMRRLVRESCDTLVRIPMSPGNNSLNVAMAGAIILSHIWESQGE